MVPEHFAEGWFPSILPRDGSRAFCRGGPSKKDGKNGSRMPPFQGLDFKRAPDSKDYALSGLGPCRENGASPTQLKQQSPIQFQGCADTHSSPSLKISFFQMGTVSFNRSITYSQDSKADLRCEADTAMTTGNSPTPKTPTRC